MINALSIGSLKKNFSFSTILSNFAIFWKIKILLFIISIYLIFQGIFGSSIGILNPAITIIWIGWWVVIVLLYLPVNAKNWCAICPIPLTGQLYNRYAPLKWLYSRKFNKKLSLFGFLPILLFLLFSALSVPISTVPLITGLVLLGLILISAFMDIYFGERTFCKEICPINPLLQNYNSIRSVSLQTLDFSICTTNHEKTCMIGGAQSYGCDWGYFPGKLKTNENDCTNCCDCIKSCNYNNLTLITKKNRFFPGENERISWSRSFLPLFFLGISIIYSITKIATIEPFHSLILIKNIPDAIITFLLEFIFSILIIPFIFLILVMFPLYKLIKNEEQRWFIVKRSTFASIPLSLAIWIVFTIYLVIPNINLLLFTVADPFLLNWNILNLKNVIIYSGMIKELFNYISQIILIIGYYSTLYYCYKLVKPYDITLRMKFIGVLGQFIFYSIQFISISIIYF